MPNLTNFQTVMLVQHKQTKTQYKVIVTGNNVTLVKCNANCTTFNITKTQLNKNFNVLETQTIPHIPFSMETGWQTF